MTIELPSGSAVTAHLQIGEIEGAVAVKNSNGDTAIDAVTGDVRVRNANGAIDVGIAEGTAAWLELNTSFGHMRNLLEQATHPEETDRRVEVRGRTSYGDITVSRPRHG